MSEADTFSSKRRVIFARLLLLTGSVVIGLALAELMVRIAAPQLYPVHPPGMYVEDRQLGYALEPGFTGILERSEFHDTVRVDETGFRGVHGAGVPAADSLVVFVLGDSQAFGFGVAEDETFSAVLPELLAPRRPGVGIVVVNGGVPGYGTADQLALLRARGPTIEPDVVVVQFLSVNDLLENSAPAPEWAAVEDGMLTSRHGAPNSGQPWVRRAERWLKANSHLAHLVSNTAGYWMMRLGLVGQQGAMWGEDFTDEQARLGAELLTEIADVADSLGAKTLFLYTTGQASVLQESYEDLPSRAVVAGAADRAGVPWVDVTERLRARNDPTAFYYPANGHWTTTGHRAVAEIVADELDGVTPHTADDSNGGP